MDSIEGSKELFKISTKTFECSFHSIRTARANKLLTQLIKKLRFVNIWNKNGIMYVEL